MLRRLKSLLGKPLKNDFGSPPDVTTIAPEGLLVVVGDIHGSYKLLGETLSRIDEYLFADPEGQAPQAKVVFVGDYVDRGEESAQVLEWLYQLQSEMPDAVYCLMGNHERMMLDFIDDPAGRGERWLRNGGLQTLASYKVGGVRERSDVEELTEASFALEAAMPAGMVDWLRGLPLMHQSGNVCVVHAAMDPHLHPYDQPRQTLLWGHNEFMTTPRTDGNWVVHGHTIVKELQINSTRIAVDTGAYHSGRLSAAVIETGRCTFI